MFKYGIDKLTIEKLNRLLAGEITGVLTKEARNKISYSRQWVEYAEKGSQPVYGINTGIGSLCNKRILPEETNKLQENLLLTHAVGVGEPIDPMLSKSMMICKVHVLSKGFSGIRQDIIDHILCFIENDLIPVVPAQGSVGASGDLAPLAHLFLPFLGEGSFWKDGGIVSSNMLLKEYHLPLMPLKSKEGLALINGTQFMLAHAVRALTQMDYLLDLADIAGAMSLEGVQGSARPFNENLQALRPFHGCIRVAEHLRRLLKDSENLASHKNCSQVQDPYSIRCIAQVHGASRNAWEHLNELVEIELNAVTDNPIILSTDEIISGGNFHGQPLAMALDYASLAAAELGSISERRAYMMLEGPNNLPRFLVKNQGINSGLMILQYTAAALVSENKTLCFPASADSIPTSLGQEDHVSMGSISSRKINQILDNVEKILAIEFIYAAQALDFRKPLKCSTYIEENLEIIRDKISTLQNDRLLKVDLEEMIKMIKNRKLVVKK